VVAAAAPLVCITVRAADWPQWRGIHRDGLSAETGLLPAWPEDGPAMVWQVNDQGDGYGAPAVVGDRIYLVVNQGMENELVKALATKDGSEIWATRIGKVGNPDQRPNFPAARSTPTVVGDRIYALGSDGDLVCLEKETGKPVWALNIREEFGGVPGSWAYAESPLVDGDLVVCAPSGPEAGVVAVERASGKVVWKSAVPGCKDAGYASTVIAENGGIRQYVSFLGHALVGVDAATGKVLWQYDKTKGQANMPTPVVTEAGVYSSTNRAPGAMVQLVADQSGVKVEEVYSSKDLPNAIGGFLVVGDHLFGTSSQYLICANVKTGDILWREPSIAPASLCYANGCLFLHGENGEVALVAASADGYKELGKFTPPNAPEPMNRMQKTWAYPALADGRLYIRNRGTLWCYHVR
jgi:outer membrane protein assembly factor BamB